MTNPNDTRERILDATQALIQQSGYSDISFSDIAAVVGIKKPSIVHHFPNKSALVEAVVLRYFNHYEELLMAVVSNPEKNFMDAFDAACTPYLQFSGEANKVCLCGALAGEYPALPESLQHEVSRFFEKSVRFFEAILEKGLSTSEFSFSLPVSAMAQHILHSLQGSLIVQRVSDRNDHVHNTIQLLKHEFQTKKG